MSNETPTDALRLVPVPYVVLSEAAGLLDCEGYGPLALTLNNLLAAAPASPLPGGGNEALIAELKEARALLERTWPYTNTLAVGAYDLHSDIRAFLARNGKGEG